MMLEKLLAEIESGGTLETRALAHKLGTSPQMVSAMLELLERRGRLSLYQNCESACAGCELAGACQPIVKSKAMQLWQG